MKPEPKKSSDSNDQPAKGDFIHADETYNVIGACMEVHKVLGCGFLEAVYQEALALEFKDRSIPFSWHKQLNIEYKDYMLKKIYNADFICYDNVILEVKALSRFDDAHMAQVLNYLKATGYKIGLLVNFGAKSLQYKRIIR